MKISPSDSTAQQLRRDLRRRVLAARDALPAAERRRYSQAAQRFLVQLPEFAAARVLFVYVNFRSEMETTSLIAHSLASGKQVAVPLTRTDPPRLEAYLITDPDRDLRPGCFSIPEPDPRRLAPLSPQAIELCVLPGSVFDRQGGRLGYGGGYYDRFLANEAPQALRLGLAFALQIVPSVPLLPHDQRLDFLATEEGVTRISARSG